MSKPGSSSSSFRITERIFVRLATSGRSTMRRRGIRRMTASSRSYGLFVAASTRTRSHSLVLRPSQLAMNSFFILRMASCSPVLSRRPSMLSTSSMNITLGAILWARVKSARTYFSPSPNHLLASIAMEMLRKFAPLSVATALASIVFPVPGGPNSRTPRVGLVREPRAKSSGRWSGSITTSRKVVFTASRAPMSSKLTPTSLAGTTSPRRRFSNSLSVCTSCTELPFLSVPEAADSAVAALNRSIAACTDETLTASRVLSTAAESVSSAESGLPGTKTSAGGAALCCPCVPSSSFLISWVEMDQPRTFSASSADSCSCCITSASDSSTSTPQRLATRRMAWRFALSRMREASRSIHLRHSARALSSWGACRMMRFGSSRWSIRIIFGCSRREAPIGPSPPPGRSESRKGRSRTLAACPVRPVPTIPMRANMPVRPGLSRRLSMLGCCPIRRTWGGSFSARRLKWRKRSTWPITAFSTSLTRMMRGALAACSAATSNKASTAALSASSALLLPSSFRSETLHQ
mmetsp:Transcript_30571/g.86441  ORF Transcript_30571/g.86441 Transcript_30571/m.86441 type:complete len:523 (-) Transcript_30571:2603-4171(-)